LVCFPVVSLVASLDHRLQAGIPKGCEGSGIVGRRCLTRRREGLVERGRVGALRAQREL
jgi:hypothetical protein